MSAAPGGIVKPGVGNAWSQEKGLAEMRPGGKTKGKKRRNRDGAGSRTNGEQARSLEDCFETKDEEKIEEKIEEKNERRGEEDGGNSRARRRRMTIAGCNSALCAGDFQASGRGAAVTLAPATQRPRARRCRSRYRGWRRTHRRCPALVGPETGALWCAAGTLAVERTGSSRRVHGRLACPEENGSLPLDCCHSV